MGAIQIRANAGQGGTRRPKPKVAYGAPDLSANRIVPIHRRDMVWLPGGPIRWPIDPVPPVQVQSPAGKATAQLKQIDARCSQDLKTLDAEIAKREKGEGWLAQFFDPTLRKLEAARSEIVQVQKDCRTAEQDLSSGQPVSSPWLDIAFRYHFPDYNEAETQINDIEGRLAHAQNLIQGVVQNAGPSADTSGLKQVLGDLGLSASQAQSAQQDVWQGEEPPILEPFDPGPLDPGSPYAGPLNPGGPLTAVPPNPGPFNLGQSPFMV